jgi:hypothetical protein
MSAQIRYNEAMANMTEGGMSKDIRDAFDKNVPHPGRQTAVSEWDKILEAILTQFANRPGDFKITIAGEGETWEEPHFNTQMIIPLGKLRTMKR